MKKLFFLPVLFCGMYAAAQTDPQGKYGAMITGADLKNYLTVIASDEFEGRETGTEGQRKAAAYIESQFSSMNLKQAPGLKSYQQLYPLYQDSVQEKMLTINGAPAEYGKDYLIPLNGNESVKFKSSNLVFAGYGIDDSAYSDYSAINVRNKIVVIFLGEPKRDGKYIINPSGKASKWTFPGIAEKMKTAAEKGAVGVLVVNPNMETFSQRMIDNNSKTNVYFPGDDDKVKRLNYALLGHAYAKTFFPVNFDEALATAKANGSFSPQPTEGKTKVEYLYRKYRTTINASNVIGVLEGTDKKDEYVFLTGHYDHLGKHNGKIYYGADDDGSGTCAVLEMAKVFLWQLKKVTGREEP